MWVCAARKKDVAWDIMREWKRKELTEEYVRLQGMFKNGCMQAKYFGEIVEDGIMRFGNYLYCKDESLEEFLERCAYSDTSRYPILVSDIVNDSEWISSEDCEDKETKRWCMEWDKKVESYIDSLEDDTVMIALDCHS